MAVGVPEVRAPAAVAAVDLVGLVVTGIEFLVGNQERGRG